MINNLFNAIKLNLISGGAYYLIAKAAVVTVSIAVIAWITTFILGSLCSYFMCYKKKVVSTVVSAICFIFRSIPVLLSLLLFYYVFFITLHISSVILAGIAIGMYGAGHFAEIISKSVKETQVWSDKDVMKRLKASYFSVAFLQAAEDSMYPIKRLMVQLLQWTTVVGYISVNDLTEVMMQIGQRNMYPFFAISFCTLFYIVIVILIEWLFHVICRNIKRKECKRRNENEK